MSSSSSNNNNNRKNNNNNANNNSNKIAAGPNPPPDGEKKPQRTIQVKIGNQAAKEMTPDQAADYLKLIAAASSSTSSRRGGPNSKGGGGAQVRMTFANHGTEATLDFGAGSPPPPSSSSTSSRAGTTTTTTITWGSTGPGGGGSSSSTSYTNVDKKKPSKNSSNNSKSDISSALTSSYAAGFRLGQSVVKNSSGNNNNTASSSGNNNNNSIANNNNAGCASVGNNNTGSSNNNISGNNNVNNNNNNMPCTEKEMKALMSMFVEIMGLSINTDKLNACKTQKFKRREYLGPKPNPSVQKLWETKSDVDKASPDDLLAALELGPPHPTTTTADDNVKSKEDAGKEGKAASSTDKEPHSSSATTTVEEDSFFIPDLPPLEDIPADLLRHMWNNDDLIPGDKIRGVDRLPNPHNYELKENVTRSGIVCGIAVPEWETLERMAMEDALEQEERARKAATAAKRKVWRPLSGTARALDNAAFLEYGNGNLPDNTNSNNNTNSKYSGMYGGSSSSPLVNNSGGGSGGGSSFNNSSNSISDPSSSASINATAALLKDAAKQRAKKCTGWRNRVVACCQSNNVQSLMEAFKDCPLHKTDAMTMWQPLFQYALPKHRQPFVAAALASKEDASNATRHALLKFLLETVDPLWFLEPDTRSGRSPLHTACYLNDAHTVGAILEAAGKIKDKDGKPAHIIIPRLDDPCLESGWPCLLYAAVAGSLRIVELLLREAVAVNTKTMDTLTWLKSNKQGATAVQFLQHMCLKQKGDKVETYGMAWSSFLEKDVASAPKQYEVAWICIIERLQGLIKDSAEPGGTFKPLDEVFICDFEDILLEAGKPKDVAASDKPKSTSDTEVAEPKLVQEDKAEQQALSSETKPKKRKKKKKGGGNSEAAAGVKKPPPASATNPLAEDPLTKLLEGMGFELEPVVQAIQALGGPNKATPDTVIAWMLDHQTENEEPEPQREDGIEDEHEAEDSDEGFEAIVAEKQSSRNAAQTKKSPRNKKRGGTGPGISTGVRQPPEAAEGEKRLQAKREEQRRRNREWNKRQEEAANAAPTLLGAGASLKVPPVPSPVAMATSTHTTSMSNDMSTVASSEVLVNDDATISTMESRSTQHQQQQPPMLLSGLPPMQEKSMQVLDPSHPQPTPPSAPAPVAPPGFVSSLLSQQDPPPSADPAPPGMREANAMPPLQGLDYSVGGPGLLTGFLGMHPENSLQPAPSPAPVASSLFPVAGDHLGGAAQLPGLQHQASIASSTGSASLPGLQHQTSVVSNSSLLGGVPVAPPGAAGRSSSLFSTDSNPPALGGSSLWGGAPLGAHPAPEALGDRSSSFLLGSVIQNSPEEGSSSFSKTEDSGSFLFDQAQSGIPPGSGFNNRTSSTSSAPGSGWGGVPPLNPTNNSRNNNNSNPGAGSIW